MNPWDVFTWISCLIVGGGAIIIFGYFLGDARGILNREYRDHRNQKKES